MKRERGVITFGRDEAREALAGDAAGSYPPVVALETAVLTHGLPRPANLEAIRSMEAATRQAGAIPAAVGVVDGQLVIGLDDGQLERLGADEAALKASARDLASLMARGESAGTTVAATLVACRLSGIRVFATGGIGGVHRGWTERPDVSADLDELARTPCCVVSAGVKSVLDIPATLEALESRGVSVLGYRCDHFPRFYSPGSKEACVPHRVEDPVSIARLLAVRWNPLSQGGVLLANPAPAEAAISAEDLEVLIEEALDDARREDVHGASLTPFLLASVNRRSGGRALQANLALLKSNALVAGSVALALSRITRSS